MPEDNVSLIRRWVEVANQRDEKRLADFYTDDAHYASPKGTTIGKENLAKSFKESFVTTPDLTTKLVRVFGDDENVALEIVVGGKTVRPHPSYPNAIAGRSFVNPQVHLFRIRDDKIWSNTVYYDYAWMMRQLT